MAVTIALTVQSILATSAFMDARMNLPMFCAMTTSNNLKIHYLASALILQWTYSVTTIILALLTAVTTWMPECYEGL